MVRGFAVLLVFQFLGEIISRGGDIPVPGNVLGMGLLLAALWTKVVRLEWVEVAAELLLSHLALFFVPAGVGVMVYFNLIAKAWLPIVTATFLSTFVVLAVTGWVAERLDREEARDVE